MQQIQLPKEGFKPRQGNSRTGILYDFFTRAWEQYQGENDACITDRHLVNGLRLGWYEYLESDAGGNIKRGRASQAASAWYKKAKDNPKYIRTG